MYPLYKSVLFVHVAFGFLGLLAFWVPIFASKGEGLHIRAGKVFLYSAYIVAGTAFAVAILSIVSPFGTHPEIRPDSAAEAAAAIRDLRMIEAFLAYLAIITLASVHHGVRAIQHRRDPQAIATPFHTGVHILAMLAGAGMLIMGLTMEHRAQWIFVALSPIGVLVGRGGLLYARRPRTEPMAHWFEHMGAMIGAGIAFHTAFAVFGIQRFIDYSLDGLLGLLPWVAPAIIGSVAIAVWQRHYRRKFAGQSAPQA